MASSSQRLLILALCALLLPAAAVEVSETQTQVEASEAAEADAAKCELLQAKVSSAPKRPEVDAAHVLQAGHTDVEAAHAAAAADATLLASTAAQEAEASTAAQGAEASFVSHDHQGNVCMLCGAPKPARVGTAKYTEFRQDCGSHSSPKGPSKEDLATPAVKFMEVDAASGKVTNGFCKLNFAKGCVDAVANKDYLYWAKSLDLEHQAMRENVPWDARYCEKNGFLTPEIRALQHNFTGLQEHARHLCATKYEQHGVQKLTFLDMMSRSRYDDPQAPSLEDANVLAAWNCAMGDLGCDMAMCAYSFCAKKDGSHGLYGECEGWDPVKGM